MDKDTYIEIQERLTEELGRKPTEDEITNEYASICDMMYDEQRDSDFIGYNGDG